uniref:Uncharacterized protein n=1 Tax=Avena sativa TaxID=4498 RepID=A0ACD5YVU6_AVESA
METSPQANNKRQQPVLKSRRRAAAAAPTSVPLPLPPHLIHSPPVPTATPNTSGFPSAQKMADSQVEAPRKAYAEIMLNMAKESAARVLAAEQRAAVLAGGVAAAKEEGVAALVRLKAIMEARIKQVESQSLAHVRKIDELQEQLHGAQNTVASLQVELQRANKELEETRKTLAEERMNILPTCDKADSNKSKISRSKMHLQNRSVSSKNNNALDDICNVPTDAKENMPSFIARNKKPELYRNGCTQRIRALKQRSPIADSSETNRKQASALNNRSKTGKKGKAKNTRQTRSIMEQILQTKFLGNCKGKRGQRSRPSYNHDSSDVHVKTEDKSSDTSDENGCLLLLQALEQDLSSHLSTGHSGEGLTSLKDDLLMGGKDADFYLCMASPGPIDAHAVSNMRMVRKKRTRTVRVSETGCSESKSVPGNNLVRSTSEDTVFKSEQSSERIDNHSDTPATHNVSILSDAADNLMHQSDAADNLMHPSDATENLIHPSGANTDQFLSGDSSPLVLQSTKSQVDGEGELQVDLLDCRTLGTDSANQKEVKVGEGCNLVSDRADPVLISSLEKEQSSKPSSGVSVQAEGARCIKYTFNRRKRKNVSLESTSQGAVPEKSSSLVSLAEKQECQAKPETQDLSVESPRGNNHLVHVARQLILLSELKWK